MLLKSISIKNYKSFQDERQVDVGTGFNIFIGANNSGKTTMLEALDFRPELQTPHRSIWSLPTYGQQALGKSSLKIKVQTSPQELRSLIGDTILIPIPETDELRNRAPEGLGFAGGLFSLISHQPNLDFVFDFGNSEEYINTETVLGTSAPILTRSGQFRHVLQLKYGSSTDENPVCNVFNVPYSAQLDFSSAFRRYFYRFSAQRNPSSQSTFTGLPVTLLQDASNLAFCLSQLQLNDSHGHRILCDWVNRVFPSIHWIQAPVLSASQWHIQCLPSAPTERRDDLAVPLQQMGTGIGNVIAILYVVLTARQPQVIAIDEPNSFLHPKALRELLQILAVEGAQHQFILTAHSADVMTAIKPTLITMFSSIEGRSNVRQVDSADIADLRADLSDLGIRMTDLHGRDRVLWVEGQTEELVIPELLRHFCPTAAAGTAVLRVEHTGTFEKKKGISPTEVAAIYKRLSQSSALVPPMVGILLDREGKSPTECARIEKESLGTLRFLDRTMLEDYVLDAEAIVNILSDLGENCTHQEVEEILSRGGSDKTAATKLENVFNYVSEARHTFRKTRDTPSIVTWLLANKPSYLLPLGRLLANIVGTQTAHITETSPPNA